MPNHWHLVLWPEEDGQLGIFMHRLTNTHVRRWHAHRQSAGRGHLYQGTYKSFPVQTDAHFLTVCRYVERNPLRARLVARAEEWRWGSLYHRQKGDLLAKTILAQWPVEQPKDYLGWVNEPQSAQELDALRTSVRRDQPFGGKRWQDRLAQLLGLEFGPRPRGRPRRS
jgi:putative transposase